jgi:Ca2+-binding EF-hand superfamily protein
MSDAQIAKFLEKFDAADPDKNGVDRTEFTKLFKEVLGKDDAKAADLYFRGIDVNGDKTVSKEEFEAFVRAALTKDTDYSLKLVFRAFDQDRSNALDGKEVQQVAQYVGRKLSEQDVRAGIERITGDPNGSLNYAQVVQLITGKEVPADTDPYEGTNPKKDEEPLPPPPEPEPEPEAEPAPAPGPAPAPTPTPAPTPAPEATPAAPEAAKPDAGSASKDGLLGPSTDEKGRSSCCILL